MEKNIIKKIARQGDVALVKVDALPAGLTETDRDEYGRIVLAYGEHSGHAHTIRDKNVLGLSMAGVDEVEYLQVSGGGGATLNHEYISGQMADHLPISLTEGFYRVVRQVEYSPEAIKRVVD
jgi:hypothetical protein